MAENTNTTNTVVSEEEDLLLTRQIFGFGGDETETATVEQQVTIDTGFIMPAVTGKVTVFDRDGSIAALVGRLKAPKPAEKQQKAHIGFRFFEAKKPDGSIVIQSSLNGKRSYGIYIPAALIESLGGDKAEQSAAAANGTVTIATRDSSCVAMAAPEHLKFAVAAKKQEQRWNLVGDAVAEVCKPLYTRLKNKSTVVPSEKFLTAFRAAMRNTDLSEEVKDGDVIVVNNDRRPAENGHPEYGVGASTAWVLYEKLTAAGFTVLRKF